LESGSLMTVYDVPKNEVIKAKKNRGEVENEMEILRYLNQSISNSLQEKGK